MQLTERGGHAIVPCADRKRTCRSRPARSDTLVCVAQLADMWAEITPETPAVTPGAARPRSGHILTGGLSCHVALGPVEPAGPEGTGLPHRATPPRSAHDGRCSATITVVGIAASAPMRPTARVAESDGSVGTSAPAVLRAPPPRAPPRSIPTSALISVTPQATARSMCRRLRSEHRSSPAGDQLPPCPRAPHIDCSWIASTDATRIQCWHVYINCRVRGGG